MKQLIAAVGFVGCLAASSTYSAGTVAAVDANQTQVLTKNVQHMYVAKQLGLLDSSKGLWRRYCGFLKKYNIELSVVSAVSTSMFFIYLLTDGLFWMPRRDGFELARIVAVTLGGGMLIGLIFGSVNSICGKLFADDADWYKGKLVSFVQQWETHKQYTPTELHPLFDQLSANSASLKIDNLFVQELYKNIAELSIKGMTAQQA